MCSWLDDSVLQYAACQSAVTLETAKLTILSQPSRLLTVLLMLVSSSVSWTSCCWCMERGAIIGWQSWLSTRSTRTSVSTLYRSLGQLCSSYSMFSLCYCFFFIFYALIPNRCSHLTDCNFLIRMLFADTYWWCFYLSLCLYYVFLIFLYF